MVAELPQLRTALQWDGPPSVPIEGINGSTLSESNDTGLVDLAYLASRHVSLIQLATASIASAAGSIAILETIPSSPLFDLQFIYGTVRSFAEVAMVCGLFGLLLIPATQRGVGGRQSDFVASVLLASAGFSGGLWVLSLLRDAS